MLNLKNNKLGFKNNSCLKLLLSKIDRKKFKRDLMKTEISSNLKNKSGNLDGFSFGNRTNNSSMCYTIEEK